MDERDQYIEKLEEIIHYCYQACRCERFKTRGFDYRENHPVFGKNGGTRKKTPKNLIEDYLGFEWAYSKESGVCPSIKKINYKVFKPKMFGKWGYEAFKTSEEYREW